MNKEHLLSACVLPGLQNASFSGMLKCSATYHTVLVSTTQEEADFGLAGATESYEESVFGQSQ